MNQIISTDEVVERAIARIEDPEMPYVFMNCTLCAVGHLYAAITGKVFNEDERDQGSFETMLEASPEFAAVVAELASRVERQDSNDAWTVSSYVGDGDGNGSTSRATAAAALRRLSQVSA